MVRKIQKWGNSQGLRLAGQVLEDVHISVREGVDVTARDGYDGHCSRKACAR